MNSILVSIIIPTYNDWKGLSLCVNALSDQTFSKDLFEVIIVNNNPHGPIPVNFSLPMNCRIIVEETPGSYAARNAALRIAKGEIIGFTDSDCIPDKNWIKNALAYFSNNNTCSRIAGKVSIFFESINPSGAELYDKVYAFNQKGYVHSGTSVTANLFTYKYVFDKVGFFDEKLMSGGDYLWGTQACKKGYKIDYVENVIVKHPARRTLKELIKKERRVGGSQAIFLEKNSSMMVINVLKFIKELRPRIGTLKLIFNNGKDLTFNDKIYIFLLRHYLLIIRAYEKLRVQMGKKPNRA